MARSRHSLSQSNGLRPLHARCGFVSGACAAHAATASAGGAHGRCWRIRERCRLLPPTRGPAEPAETHALVASGSRPCWFQPCLDKACGAGDEETGSSGAVKRHRTCSDPLRALGPAKVRRRRVRAPPAREESPSPGRPRAAADLPRARAVSRSSPSPLRRAGAACLPSLRRPGAWLPAAPLRQLWARSPRRLLVQTTRLLPVLRRAPHGGHRSAPG